MNRHFTKKRNIVLGTLAVALVAICLVSGMGSTIVTCINCKWRLRTGMTLEEAEAVIGPFEKETGGPPGYMDYQQRMVPLVQGEECYRRCENGVEVYIGLRDGHICDKWWGVELLP